MMIVKEQKKETSEEGLVVKARSVFMKYNTGGQKERLEVVT